MMATLEAKAPSDFARLVAQRARAAHAPGSAAGPAAGQTSRWVEVPADEVGELLLQAWYVSGVDYVFFNTGSDIVWYQEGTLKLAELGRPTPRLLAHLHETVALAAASGYSMVSRRPSVTAVHADLGTLNYGGNIHNVWHGGNPVLMTAGRIPTAYGGTQRGDRDQWHFWHGDMRDYGAIVRQYVKWDYNLGALDQAGLVAARAIQVMLSEPSGPAYLTIPRDVAFQPVHGGRFPTVLDLGLPEPPEPNRDAVRQAARWLVEAERPLVVAGRAGDDPAAVAALVALCDLLALPVDQARGERLNLPASHPMHGGGPALGEADLVLVLESLVPWLPGHREPSPEAKIVWVGLDPAAQHHVHYEYPGDLRITASPASALAALRDEAERLLTAGRRAAIEERRAAVSAASRAHRARLDERAQASSTRQPIAPAYVGYELGRLLRERDALVLDDAVGNSPNVFGYCLGDRPGSYYRCGGGSGGWGPGAAFGAKLAAPERFVALASGDGFFLYGVPNVALWSAVRYGAPFLGVVFQNASLGTGTERVWRYYPEGVSARKGSFEGGLIDPPHDLAKLAESAGAYGENVAEPEDVQPALERAMRMVEQGTPAIVAVKVPQVGRETAERS